MSRIGKTVRWSFRGVVVLVVLGVIGLVVFILWTNHEGSVARREALAAVGKAGMAKPVAARVTATQAGDDME